ncbi:DUF4097 domain-containing protein [Paenibacillus sp. GCM10023248]|uniref:DUF4097 family beta strand repeat-containing protein n=1 Tax=unclassified Paenibacillus TaxID=185978 RepID=UPI002378992F|nr:DUF4097 family beta strand repeat-containing protein [Paenibacillus sp. MAHUQ-63]MDD9271828.1 DUF4097 family beta strand repeat-containing protein [Paenibacillus sp. MAHUQ-63]
MKRGYKFFLLTGFACLAVGLVGSAISFKTLDLEAGIAKVDIEKKISAASIDTIIIQNDISNITFVPTNGDEIKVRLSGTMREQNANECTVEAVTEGSNVWRVDVCTKEKDHFDIGFDITEFKNWIAGRGFGLKTEVSLPDKMYKAITVNSDTGGIALNDLKAEKLTVNTDTGNISLDRYEGKSMNLQTDTGSIHIQEGQGDAKLKTDTGSITARMAEIGESVSLESDTGSVRLTLDPVPKNVNFDLAADTGAVNLEVPGLTVDREDHHAAKGTLGDGSKKVKIRVDTGYISVTGR